MKIPTPLLVAVAVLAFVLATNTPQTQPMAPTPEVQPTPADGVLTFKVDEEKAWAFMAYLVQEGRWTETDQIVRTAEEMQKQGTLKDLSRIEPYRPSNLKINDSNKPQVIKQLTGGNDVPRSEEFATAASELDQNDESVFRLVGWRKDQRVAIRCARLATRVAASGWSFSANSQAYAVAPPANSYCVDGNCYSPQYQASQSQAQTLMRLTPYGWMPLSNPQTVEPGSAKSAVPDSVSPSANLPKTE